ncbi:hypothetical protein JCM10908_004473 [Rhodotorula pacifica]|uniref:FG-GAP repeat domain-containing protein n=1 Tax=Rhodotorula pacifica TaxID=1495444 RepID=UPI00317BBEE7
MLLACSLYTLFLVLFLLKPHSTATAVNATDAVTAASSWLPTWSPFHPGGGSSRRFTEEKLLDAGSLNLPTNQGLVAAWVDWNGDQHLDLVLLSSDQRSLSVHLWNRKQFRFLEPREGSELRTPSDFVITNVVPGDYDFDGRIDLLVMGGKNPGGWWGEDETTEMRVYLQQPDGSFGEAIEVDAATLAQPIPLDGNGDMRTDLLGYSAADPKRLQMWRNSYSTSNTSSAFSLTDAPLDYSSHPSGTFTCRFPSPHFNAFVDLDGDCLADLFFVCLGGKNRDDPDELEYQVWVNSKGKSAGGDDDDEEKREGGRFVFKREGKLPRGTKSVSLGDMDRDGTIDLVVTSCPKSNQHECLLTILYNNQIPLCDSTIPASQPCRDPEALCTSDPDFAFTLREEATATKIEDLTDGRRLVVRSTGGFRGEYPLAAQVGDFNIDGYPDLLIVTSDPHHSKRDKRAQILESVACGKGVAGCTEEDVKKKRRAFRLVESGAEALEKITDVESASWVDLDDDGTLDILVQRAGNSGAARVPVFIKNNYFHDAFFLKAQVLNGACQGWCEPRPGTDEKRYRPFGSSYSGASFKFTVLDPTGARRSTQFAQLPQSSYMSLSTPYSYCGLGRTNNYVENLFVGSTRHQPQHFINIEGLIPNSQVLINPYQSEGVNEPSGWSKMLYLRPGDWIPWVTVVLLAAIFGLGIVVIVLHVREKREDEAERRARLLSLNFQAL